MAALSNRPESFALQLAWFHHEHHLSLCLGILGLKLIKHALKKERADPIVSVSFSIRSSKHHVLNGPTTWWRVSCLCADSKGHCKCLSTRRAHTGNFTVSAANSVLHWQASAHLGGSDLASCFTQRYPLCESCPSLSWSQAERRRLLGSQRTCCDGFYFSFQCNFKNLNKAKKINVFVFYLYCPTGPQTHRNKSDRFLSVFFKEVL